MKLVFHQVHLVLYEGDLVRLAPAVAVTLLLTAMAHGAEPKTGESWPEFQERIEAYLKVHKTAERSVSGLKSKADPAKMRQHEQALAHAIRAARTDAKEGDLLGPPVAARLMGILKTELKGPANRPVRDAFKDGNPRRSQAALAINAAYPEKAPLSTMPPSLLLRLPKLPEDLEYRFVGRALILYDHDANLIVDYLPNAAPPL